jgi:hypothetical protein
VEVAVRVLPDVIDAGARRRPLEQRRQRLPNRRSLRRGPAGRPHEEPAARPGRGEQDHDDRRRAQGHGGVPPPSLPMPSRHERGDQHPGPGEQVGSGVAVVAVNPHSLVRTGGVHVDGEQQAQIAGRPESEPDLQEDPRPTLLSRSLEQRPGDAEEEEPQDGGDDTELQPPAGDAAAQRLGQHVGDHGRPRPRAEHRRPEQGTIELGDYAVTMGVGGRGPQSSQDLSRRSAEGEGGTDALPLQAVVPRPLHGEGQEHQHGHRQQGEKPTRGGRGYRRRTADETPELVRQYHPDGESGEEKTHLLDERQAGYDRHDAPDRAVAAVAGDPVVADGRTRERSEHVIDVEAGQAETQREERPVRQADPQDDPSRAPPSDVRHRSDDSGEQEEGLRIVGGRLRMADRRGRECLEERRPRRIVLEDEVARGGQEAASQPYLLRDTAPVRELVPLVVGRRRQARPGEQAEQQPDRDAGTGEGGERGSSPGGKHGGREEQPPHHEGERAGGAQQAPESRCVQHEHQRADREERRRRRGPAQEPGERHAVPRERPQEQEQGHEGVESSTPAPVAVGRRRDSFIPTQDA